MTTKSRKNAVVVAKLSGSKADNMPNSLDCVISPRLPLLNRFFDRVIPAIEAKGGEILKFLGMASLRSLSTLAARLPIAPRPLPLRVRFCPASTARPNQMCS
jgi:hypothetical protein